MELKHTPAPWRIASKKKSNCFYFITAKDITSETDRDIMVVEMNYGSHPIKEHLDRVEADATLIAAAPQLLEELINAREFIRNHTGFKVSDHEYHECVSMIDTAIAKATNITELNK